MIESNILDLDPFSYKKGKKYTAQNSPNNYKNVKQQKSHMILKFGAGHWCKSMSWPSFPFEDFTRTLRLLKNKICKLKQVSNYGKSRENNK